MSERDAVQIMREEYDDRAEAEDEYRQEREAVRREENNAEREDARRSSDAS